MSERPETGEGRDTPKFQRYFIQHGRYTAGMSVTYAASRLTGEAGWQSLAPGFSIGTRFHSAPVVRLADAKPLELGHVVKADARWRLFAFCPDEDPSATNSAVRRLCDFLAASPASPVLAYTRPGEDIDAVIDLRVIFQQPSRDLSLETLPAFLFPRKGRYGLVDYEKAFCAVSGQGRDIFDLRGIDRKQGCLVIVRPDQHVAHVLPFEAHAALAQFFDGFMLAAPADEGRARRAG